MELNQKRIVRAWSFYDWANSAYSLIITSAIFPAYFTAIIPEQVNLLGRNFHRDALASYSISLSFLIIAFLSPILSSIADSRSNKKMFLRFFCYLGSLSCMALFFFEKNTHGHVNLIYGLCCSILASIGFCGSLVFYNAFLPEIASKDQQDAVSANGFSMGYIGSVILMIFCFAFILADEQLKWGLGSLPVRMSFVAVGIWWMGFAQITFAVLKEDALPKSGHHGSILFNGFQELKKVWHQLKQIPVLKRFLFAFFFYNMGVLTVMYMATYFAGDALHMETTQLLSVILIIQLVAIAGARLFAYLSQRWGNRQSLIVLVLIWICICIAAYKVVTVNQFYILAFCVGMVMGGIQSLSRSTYSKLLPDTEDHASFFSFYDVCEKLGIVIGTLSFGLISDYVGLRASALGLAVYFVIGLIGLFWMKDNFVRKSSGAQ
ncbi:MAG: MFS transporter [Chitinophagaceae bacterium]|nr:MFS transporter [Chitinophagaceae bacterium]